MRLEWLLPLCVLVPACLFVPALGGSASATSLAPPMLDINAMCEAGHKRNVDAISECVVAESEARSEILQKWDKVSDADAQRCIKLSRKTKKLPYDALARCLPVVAAAPPVTPK
jgi:hypothetical protein